MECELCGEHISSFSGLCWDCEDSLQRQRDREVEQEHRDREAQEELEEAIRLAEENLRRQMEEEQQRQYHEYMQSIANSFRPAPVGRSPIARPLQPRRIPAPTPPENWDNVDNDDTDDPSELM